MKFLDGIMTLERCDSCYNIPGLRENYGSVLDEYEIYTGDSENFPGKNVLGLIQFPLKEVRVRKDTKGKYIHVPVRGLYKVDNKNVFFEGTVPVDLFEFAHYHEFEHALYPEEKSEGKINRRALEKYIDYYIKKNMSSYIKESERKVNSYII